MKLWKSGIDDLLRIRTLGRMMEASDVTKELWF